MADSQPNFFVSALHTLASQMICGDLALRRQSIEHLSPHALQPTLLIARHMKGDISVSMDVQEDGFILSFNKEQWTPFDGTVSLTLEPVLETHLKRNAVLTLVPPVLLAQAARPGPLIVRIPGGKYLWFSIDKGKIQSAVSSDLSQSPQANQYKHIKKWTGLQLLNFLSAMEAWASSTSQTPGLPFDPGRNESPTNGTAKKIKLAGVLRQIIDGFTGLQVLLRGGFLQQSDSTRHPHLVRIYQNLRDFHPDLAGHYRLHDLCGQIILWLTGEGRLADQKNSDKALKLAFDLVTVSNIDQDELRLRPFPPDILVEGPFHEKLIRAMKAKERAHVGFDFSAKVMPGDKSVKLFDRAHRSDVKNFFQAGDYESRTVFIRIKRVDDEEDLEIVLIRGQVLPDRPAWFIFQMEVKGFSKDTPKLGDISLIAGYNGNGRYHPPGKAGLADYSNFYEYLKRIIQTLDAWQRELIIRE